MLSKPIRYERCKLTTLDNFEDNIDTYIQRFKNIHQIKLEYP